MLTPVIRPGNDSEGLRADLVETRRCPSSARLRMCAVEPVGIPQALVAIATYRPRYACHADARPMKSHAPIGRDRASVAGKQPPIDEETDLLIIGAGPAGISAALTAAAAAAAGSGVRVTL